MKKFAITLLMTVLAGCLVTVSAQNITIGAKGGFSIPNLTGGGSANPLNSGYSSRLGIGYGVYGEYHFTPLFSISVGAEYSSQGGQKDKLQAFPVADFLLKVPQAYRSLVNNPSNQPYFYGDFKSVAKINYLLIPILAHFTVGLGEKSPFSVYLATGPFVGYLLNANQITSGSSKVYYDELSISEVTMYNPLYSVNVPLETQSFDNTQNIKSQLHKFNVGIEGFLGVTYKISSKHSVFIEGGGNFGFVPIQQGNANGNNRTGAGTVSLGYAYTL